MTEVVKAKRTRRPSVAKDLFIVLLNGEVVAVTRSAAEAIRAQDANDGSKIKVFAV